MLKMKETWSKMAKKMKMQLVFLSFILSFVVQLLYLNVNYEVILKNRNHLNASVSQTEHMDVRGDVYTATGNTGSIYFDWERGTVVGEVLIALSAPLSNQQEVVLYHTTEKGVFYALETVHYKTNIGDEFLLFTFDPRIYMDLRLDFLHATEVDLAIEGIYFLEEPMTFWEKTFSKISVFGTFFFSSLIMLFLNMMMGERHVNQNKKYLPYLFLGLFYFYIFQKQNLFSDDAFTFIPQTTGVSFWDFTVLRYFTWSSRQVIEGFIYVLVYNKLLWAILSSLLCVISCWSLGRLVWGEKEAEHWLIVGLFFLFPFGSMSEVGWIATSTNYFWVLALGVFSLLGVRDSLDGKVVSKWQLLLYSLATIYAANQEQGAALLVGFYLVFFLYFKVEKISIKPLLLPFSISFCSLIYHLVCPGNYLRKEEHKMTFFPDFDTLSLGTKVEMAYSSTLYALFIEMNILFAMLCLMMVLVAVLEKKRRVIACMVAPVTVILFFAVLGNSLQYMFPWFKEIKYAVGTTGTEPSFSNPMSLLPLCIITICLVSFLCGLYYLFQDKRVALFQVIIFLAGFASRMIMGLSPTIWLSGHRTFIFLYFCLMVITLFVYQKMYEYGNVKYLKIVKKSLICAGIYSVIILIQTPFFVVAY